jgi:hypothetical protein
MIKSNNLKKRYTRPELDIVEVDHEISIMMLTQPGDPPTVTQQVVPPSESSPVHATPPSYENDPFGGSSPSY